MQFLYPLLNIVLPLSLLSYFTGMNLRKKVKVGFGQWFLLIISIAVFNVFYTLFHFTWIMYIIDMGAKMGSVFIPQNINNNLEQKIADLHLQLYVDMLKSKIIGQIFRIHCLITDFLLGKMSEKQAQHYKNVLIERLTHKSQLPQKNVNTDSNKYSNYGHDYINEAQFPDSPKIKQFVKQDINMQKNTQRVIGLQPINPKNLRTVTFGGGKRQTSPHANFQINGNSLSDQNRPKQDINSYNYQYPLTQTNRGVHPQSSSYDTNKISKFTAMTSPFQKNPSQKSINRLICKVEAIVQIGTSYQAIRLQFYILQLYSNSDLRIISTNGAQFERHKLFSIKPLQNHYYDLYFASGKKRKVKFRGNAEPFMKYL